jgi:hypothetical protein
MASTARDARIDMAIDHGWEVAFRGENRDLLTRGDETLNLGYNGPMLANVDHRTDPAKDFREIHCAGPIGRAYEAEKVIVGRQEIVEWAIRVWKLNGPGARIEHRRGEEDAKRAAEELRGLDIPAEVLRRTISPWEAV